MVREVGYLLKGMLMGAADLIPGISGGTIALITGIYGRLIGNIHTFFHRNPRYHDLRGYAANLRDLDYRFLIPLFFGIMTVIIAGARTIPGLIEAYPVAVYSLFLGIILASTVYLGVGHARRSVRFWLFFLVALLVGLLVGFVREPAEHEAAGLLISFLLGSITISALVLPGISGSYILLVLGYYVFILSSIRDFFDALVVLVVSQRVEVALVESGLVLVMFGLGALAGLFVLSKLLNRALTENRALTIFTLTGLMLGASYAIVRPIAAHDPVPFSVLLFFAVGVGVFVALRLLERVIGERA